MSKKGKGPPPQIVSKPTIPPQEGDDDSAQAPSAVADLSSADPSELDLLSSAMPDGLTDPYAPTQDGWIVAPQATDPYSGLVAQSGPLNPYAGSDIDPYTNLPPEDINSNAFTGGNNADPYGDFLNTELSANDTRDASQWSGPSQTAFAADNSSSNASVGAQNYDALKDYLAAISHRTDQSPPAIRGTTDRPPPVIRATLDKSSMTSGL
jgi:hypothetical protein